MKRVALLTILFFTLTAAPFAYAAPTENRSTVLIFSVAETSNAETPTEEPTHSFIDALNAQDAALLAATMDDNVRFGSFYGAWWDAWDALTQDEIVSQLLRYDAMGQVSAEVLPDESTWFLQDLNPYTDLLIGEQVATVLLVENFSENADAEMLAWFSAEGEVIALVYSATGFQH